MQILKIFPVVLLWSLIQLVLSGITPSGNSPVKPYSSERGVKTFFRISFGYDRNIITKARIQVQFPQELKVDQFDPILECSLLRNIFDWTTYPCTYTLEGLVTVQVGQIISGENQLVIGRVMNPEFMESSSYFSLCLLFYTAAESCYGNFGKVIFSAPAVSIAAPMVTALSNLMVNQGSSWRFQFSLKGIYSAGNSLRFTFPQGFRSNFVRCEVSELLNSSPESQVLHNKRMVECRNIQKELSGVVVVNIINMVNPNFSGRMKGFSIEMIQGSSNIVVEKVTFDSNVIIESSPMKASFMQNDMFQLSNTTYYFFMNIFNSLDDLGKIQIVFDTRWTLWSERCYILKGIDAIPGVPIDCQRSPDANTYIYEISNFQRVNGNDQIVVKVDLQSPAVEGDYPVQIQTVSQTRPSSIIENAVLTLPINATYGQLKEFRAHAVHKPIKLPAGDSGPLEFTFFLKTPLPQTNVLTTGQFVVDIFPGIPVPPTCNGIVTCIFFENVPASNCDYVYNAAAPTSTRITMMTPEDHGFHESEIPITITTKGATAAPGCKHGIKLDPLVQRYLLHVHMYNSADPLAAPTEVYFQEWIPDAFEIPVEIPPPDISFLPIVKERGEYTHIKMTFQNQIFLPANAQGRMYLFRLTFKTETCAWRNGLGHNDDKIFVDFPCYFSGGAGFVAVNDKCDLYTEDKREPFIQGYGFQSLGAGVVITFDFGNIQLDSLCPVGTPARVRFSVVEQTPGMLDDYVELYFKELEFLTMEQSYATWSINPSIVVNQNNPYPNKQSTNYITFIPRELDPDYLIYQIDKTAFPDITSDSFNCVDNPNTVNCVKLHKNPTQWIVQTKDPQITGTVRTEIPGPHITNPPYSGKFNFKVRAMRQGQVINRNIFEVVVKPEIITAAVCHLAQVGDYVVKRSEHQFYVKFTTLNKLPNMSRIRLTFQYIQTQSNKYEVFCRVTSATLMAYDFAGIRCRIISSIQFEIYNIGESLPGEVQVNLRLLTDSNPTVVAQVDIRTYYDETDATKEVDFVQNIKCMPHPSDPQVTIVNNIDNPKDFHIDKEMKRPDEPVINYVGPVELLYKKVAGSLANTIQVTFDDGYTTPLNPGTTIDPLRCTIDGIRYDCDYITAVPLAVRVDLTTRTTGIPAPDFKTGADSSERRLLITTEHISPNDGIKHPPTSGYKKIDINIKGDAQDDMASQWIFVRPVKLGWIYVEYAIQNSNLDNLFIFHERIFSAVPSYLNGGRIQFEFPTLDPVQDTSRPLFTQDLGHYKTGEEIGCWFQTTIAGYILVDPLLPVGTLLRCRFIASEILGEPAVIEVINFAAIPATAAGILLEVRVAKIRNPIQIAGKQYPDVWLGIRVFDFKIATGITTEIEYDRYNLFMDIVVLAFKPKVFHPAPTLNEWFEGPSEVGEPLLPTDPKRYMKNSVYYDEAFAKGDYYVVDVPKLLPVDDLFFACSAAQYEWCISFPEVNWIVMKLTAPLAMNTESYLNEVILKKLPESVPQEDTVFFSYPWIGRREKGVVESRITELQWHQLIGPIDKGAIGLVVVDRTEKLLLNRKNVEVMGWFTTNHVIRKGGSIEFTFKQDIPGIRPHCRSAVTVGSMLNPKAAVASGQIGCQVQNTASAQSWVLRGFDDIPRGTYIRIYGVIDLPTAMVAPFQTGILDITTYGTYDETSNYNNAEIVDRMVLDSFTAPNPPAAAAPANELTITNLQSMDIETIELINWDVDVLRQAQKFPFKAKMKIGSTIQANKGGVRVAFYRNTLNLMKTWTYPEFNSDFHVCEFDQFLDQLKIGCQIIAKGIITDAAAPFHDNYYFDVMPNEDIVANEPYYLVITTVNGVEGIEPEGIRWPRLGEMGSYQINFAIGLTGFATFTVREHLYFEVVGPQFQTLEFTSYVQSHMERNLFIIKFQPKYLVKSNDQLVIEFPTQSPEGRLLFDDHLGYNVIRDPTTGPLQDYDNVPFDIVDASGDYIHPMADCKYFMGDQTWGHPAQYICSNWRVDNDGLLNDFTATPQDITTASWWRLAFDIYNPTVDHQPFSEHSSIPVVVYTYQIVDGMKNNYELVENAFYLGPGYVVNGEVVDFNLGPNQETVCHFQLNTFTFRTQQTRLLLGNTQDAYILRFRFHIRNDNFRGIRWNGYDYAGVTATFSYLKNLRSMIFFMGTADNIRPNILSVINGGVPANNFWTPQYRLEDPNQRVVIGYACYVSHLWTEKIIYTDAFPIIQPQRMATPSDVTLAISQYDVVEMSMKNDFDLTFTITSKYFRIVQRICILLPDTSQFQMIGYSCKQHQDSEIEVSKCWVDPVNPKYIWIDVAPGGFNYPLDLTDVTPSRTLMINTNNHAVRMPMAFALPNYYPYLDFYLKFYSWEVEPAGPLNPLTEEYVCFSDDAQLDGNLGFVDRGVWGNQIFKEIEIPNEQYIDEFRPFKATHRAPIMIEIMSAGAIAAATAPNLNEFRLYYGDNIIVPVQNQFTDILNEKLICTVQGKRVKCLNDAVNKRIVAYFWDAVANDQMVFGHFTVQDINDPEKDGFLYNFPATSRGMQIFQVELFDQAGGITYYGVGDNIPVFYKLPAGVNDLHRGIQWANFTWTTRWESDSAVKPMVLNVYTLTFYLNRDDIKGLTVHFSTKNEDKSEHYRNQKAPRRPEENFRPSMLDIESAAPFPCSRGITSAGTSNPVHCLIEAGWNLQNADYGSDIVIHMYDFTYVANTYETFRLLINTPNQVGDSYVSFITRAWGGQITYDRPYGDEFMGEYQFERIYWHNDIQPGSFNADFTNSNAILTNRRFLMTRPAWDNREDNILRFELPVYLNIGVLNPVSDHLNGIAEIYLESQNIPITGLPTGLNIASVDNTWGDFCVVTPKYLVTDYFETEIVDANTNPPTFKRIAYVYRKFEPGEIAPGQAYWDIGYVKCKHYVHGIRTFTNYGMQGWAYWGDARWNEERRSFPDQGTGRAVANNKVVTGVEWEWSTIHAGTDVRPKTFHIRMDTLANPYLFGPRFPEMVMQIDFTVNGAWVVNIQRCKVIQGIFIYENRHRGREITCIVTTGYQIIISGFDSIEINDPAIDQQYFRVMIWSSNTGVACCSAGYISIVTGPLYMRLFANEDARRGGDGNLIFYNQVNFPNQDWNMYNVPLNPIANNPPYNPNFRIISFLNNGGGSQLVFEITAPSYIRSHAIGCCPFNAYFDLQIHGIDMSRFTTGCSIDIRNVAWPVGDPARYWWAAQGAVGCGLFFSTEYVLIRITYNDQDGPMHGETQWSAGVTYRFTLQLNNYYVQNHDRNYMWFHFWAQDQPYCVCCCGACFCPASNYWLVETQWQVPRRNAFSSVTINSLSQNINSVTEFQVDMWTVQKAVGINPPTKTNPHVIMIEFDSPDWAKDHGGTPLPDLRDDLIWGAEETDESVQINCKCGIIGNPILDSNCFRRQRMVSSSTYHPAIFIYFDAVVNSHIKCFIPEIILPETVGVRTLRFRLVQPSLYPDYFDATNGVPAPVYGYYYAHGYNNVRYNDVNINVNQNNPGATKKLTGDLKPAPFYLQRTVGEFFVGYYGLKVETINTPTGLDRPYFYLRNSWMGPYASTELCDILPNWSINRIYNTLTYVAVCKRMYNPSVDAYIEAGEGLQFPDGRYEKNGQPDWRIYAYIYGLDKIFYNQFDRNDNFPYFKAAEVTVKESKHAVWSTNKAGYWATHVIRFNLNGFTLYSTLDQGVIHIQIPRNQVSEMSNGCTAYVENEFNQKVSCRPDTRSDATFYLLRVVRRPFTIDRFSNEAQNLTTTNAINVVFHIQNPYQYGGSVANNIKIDYQIEFYKRWQTPTWHWIQVKDTIKNELFDMRNEVASNVRVARSKVKTWQFFTKIIHPLRYEKRVFFKQDFTTQNYFHFYQYPLATMFPALPSGATMFDVKDVKIQCYWREFDVVKTKRYTYWPCTFNSPWLWMLEPTLRLDGVLRYDRVQIQDYDGWGRNMVANRQYQLIFTCIWNNDFIAWPRIPLTTLNNHNSRLYMYKGGNYYHFLERTYNYQGKDQVNLLKFYYTSGRSGEKTSFYFQFQMTPSLNANQVFPDSYFQLEFNQLQRADTGLNEGDEILCHLDEAFYVKIPIHYHSPRCIVNDNVRDVIKQLVIRIEQFYTIPGNQPFWIAIDDITLPNYGPIYTPLDLDFRFFQRDSTWAGGTTIDKTKLFYKRFKEIMIIDGRSPSANTAAYGAFTFPQLTDAEQTYGITGVSYPVDLTGWPTTTDGYWNTLTAFAQAPKNSGQKMRFQMLNGGLPATNQIETLKFQSQNGDLPLLWFNRQTNSVYLGLPAINAGSLFTFTVYQATNPWPFQMEEWGTAPTTQMTSYTGHLLNVYSDKTDDNPHRELRTAELKWNDNHSYGSYKKEANRIRIDTAKSYTTDTYPSMKVFKNQNYFIKFHLVNDLVDTDLKYRQFNLLRFQFTAGVDSIEGCWIHPSDQVPMPALQIPLRNRHAHCVIKGTPNKQVHIRGLRENFEDINWVSDWHIWISLKLSTNQFSYTFTSEVDNGQIQHILSPTSIVNDIDDTGVTSKPLVFDFLQGKYFRGYYEFAPTYKYALPTNQISRLRWRFRPNIVLDFNTLDMPYMNVYLPPGLQNQFVNLPLVPENEMRCYLHEEANEPNTNIGEPRQIGMPLFSWCSVVRTADPWYFNITVPRFQIFTDRYYVLHVRERRRESSMKLPEVPRRHEMLFHLHDAASPVTDAYDTFIVHAYGQMITASVVHYTTTEQTKDTIELSFKPFHDMPLATLPSESYLVVDMIANYYKRDVGLDAVYQYDKNGPFISGYDLPYLMNPPHVGGKMVVNFGQHSTPLVEYQPIRFALFMAPGLLTTTNYTIKIPIVQNPAGSNPLSHYYTVYMVTYQNGVPYPLIYNKYSFVNHAWIDPVHTDMTTTNFDMLTTNNNFVQVDGTFGLTVRFNYNIDYTQNRIVLKWDQNKDGVQVPVPWSTNLVTGCKVDYYPVIDLLVLTPTNHFTAWSVFNLGGNYFTEEYIKDWGFSWVYISETQKAKYQRLDPTKTLFELTDTVPPPLFTRLRGLTTLRSHDLYSVTITIPRLPEGGFVEIKLHPSYHNAHIYRCEIETGWTLPLVFENGPLSCLKEDINTYILRGFGARTPKGKIVKVQFYAYAIGEAAVVNLQYVRLYGTLDYYNQIAIWNNVASVPMDTVRDGPTTFQIDPMVYSHIFAKEWSPLDFFFQSYANSITSTNPNFDQIKLAMPITPGAWTVALGPTTGQNTIEARARYKDRLLSETRWAEFQYAEAGGTFDLKPALYPTDYFIPASAKEMIYIDTQRGAGSTAPPGELKEGVYHPDRNIYTFWFEIYKNAVLKERAYHEFILEPRQDLDHTFKVNPLIKYAGYKTPVGFQFTMNYDKADPALKDEIWVEFYTHNDLWDEFDFGLGILAANEDHRQISCSEPNGIFTISNTKLNCYLYRGSQNNTLYFPTLLRIPIAQSFTETDKVEFWIPSVKNPLQTGLNVGVRLRIMRQCRQDLGYLCPIYQAETFYKTTTAPAVFTTSTSVDNKMIPDPNLVDSMPSTHRFVLQFITIVQPIDHLLFIYPTDQAPNDVTNYINTQNTGSCTVTTGKCIDFPEFNWALYQTGATISPGINSVFLQNMKNGYHRRADVPIAQFQVWALAGGAIQEKLIVPEDWLEYLIRGPFTFKQTQAPIDYFLKEDFVNVVEMKVNGIWTSKHIQSFRFPKPVEINYHQYTYCNASFSLPAHTPYPYRLKCEIFDNFIHVRAPYSGLYTWTNDFVNGILTVYFQMKIPDTVPAGTIANQHVYGCVLDDCYDATQSTDNIPNKHVSNSTTTFQVSGLPLPNIGDAAFNTKAFHERKARVNELCQIYSLIRPYSQENVENIDKIVFTLPDEFVYPSIEELDACRMFARGDVDLTQCSLMRKDGQTTITLAANNYDELVQIVELATKNNTQLFRAPKYPGDFYPIGIELYEGDLLREKQTQNMSMILGYDLDLNTLQVLNGLDQKRNMLYDFQFQVGIEQVPAGYEIDSQDIRSEIWFIFEWQGDGYDVHRGYTKDLSTGQKDLTELGCVAKSGLQIPSGKRLTCILDYGSGPEDMPTIIVSGYERILPNTFVNILITQIGTISISYQTVISTGVKLHFRARSVSSFLYGPTPFVPDVTTAWIDALSTSPMTVVVSGSDQVLDYSTYAFTFTTRLNPVFSTDYFGFQFPEGFIFNMAGYTGRPTICSSTTSSCPQVYVFGVSNMIYINPSGVIPVGITLTLTLTDVPNPDYVVNANSFTIEGFLMISRQIDTRYSFTFSKVFQPGTQISFFQANPIDSVSAGEIGVQYQFPFITGHRIPNDGAISVTFPAPYGNLLEIEGTGCSLKGGIFDDPASQATCQIGAANRVDIYLNGQQLDQLEQYTLTVTNLINPYVPDLAAQNQFLLTSWIDNNIESGKQICEKETDAPNLIYSPPFDCVFQIDNFYQNAGYQTVYTFTFTCFNIVKENTLLIIDFPLEFEKRNYLTSQQQQQQQQQGSSSDESYNTCMSHDQGVLADSNCPLKVLVEAGQTIALNLEVKLRSIQAQRRFSIQVEFINPDEPYEQYHFDANFLSNGFKYAKARDPGAYLSVYANDNIIQASNQDSKYQVQLLNIPKNSGQPSTYIFQIPPVEFLVLTNNINIQFPIDEFSSQVTDPYPLSCGVFTTYQEESLDRFSYQRILQLRNGMEVDPTFTQAYTDLPCSVTTQQIVTLTDLWKIVNDTQKENMWTYYMIYNVINPGATQTKDFRIVYEAKNSISWYFDGPLTYFISTAPQYLKITKLETPNDFVLTTSDYIFSYTTEKMLQNNVKVAVSILFPQIYDEILATQSKTLNCSISITKKPYSDCQLYGRELIILEETAYIRTQNYITYVSQFINPNHLSSCLDGIPALQNQFFIKVYDANSDEVLAASSFVDYQNCLTFRQGQFWIRPSGPRVLSFGLSYDFYIALEKPARNMSITVNTDINGLQVYPDVLLFENYQSDQLQFEVIVQNEIVYGQYILSFLKQENEKPGYNYYSDILNLEVEIVPYDPLFNLQPLIYIDDQCANTVGHPIFFKVLLEKPPAKETILTMEVRSQKEHAGVFGFSVTPPRILLNMTTVEAEFSVTYTGNIVPPPQTLLFSLTSFHTVIHQVIPSQQNIVFQLSNTINTIPPTLQICLQNAINDEIYEQINTTVLSIYNLLNQTNTTTDSGSGSTFDNAELIERLKPRILKVFALNVRSTSVDIVTVVSDSSKVFLCAYLAQTPPPTTLNVTNQNCTPMAISRGSNTTERDIIQDIDYNSTITLQHLESQTLYTAYVVAVSPLGISLIEQITFKTKPLNFGATLLISVTDLVDSDVLMEALELTLRVSQSRLQIITSNEKVKEQFDRYNPQYMHQPQITYEICITPDQLDDDPAPIAYIQALQSDSLLQEFLQINLPIWDSTEPLLGKELQILRNQIIHNPLLEHVDYYNITVSLRLWEGARYFAVALKKSDLVHQPLSQQLFQNLSDTNQPLQNFHSVSGKIHFNDTALITFDDLQEGVTYDIFITAGNDLPYDPPLLLEESDIKQITVKTLHNFNVDPCGALDQMRTVDSELAQLLEGYVQHQGTMNRCYTIIQKEK